MTQLEIMPTLRINSEAGPHLGLNAYARRVAQKSCRPDTARYGSLHRGEGFAERTQVLARAQERRLLAIMVADAVNYSSLMGFDEEGTHRKYKSDLDGVIRPLVEFHRGRVVKKTGDGVLAIFPSAVEAVDCAGQMQGIPGFAASRSKPELTYRIGINIGDVIVEDDDVYGNDVNVAVRLESLAPPGGLAISGVAYWNVKGRTEAGFEELGFLRLKNISEPIQVYQTRGPNRPGLPLAERPEQPGVRPLSGQRTWSEGRAHQPEVVVLPFDNLSSEPQQDFLCDGLVNDLTTDLSRFSNIFVISASTAFSYKRQHPTHERIRRELSVEYMVEGSVQRAANQLRINVQLIETTTGRHLWADRFLSSVENVFELQDTVCRKIVMALVNKVSDSEMARATRKETHNVSAYEAFLRGVQETNIFFEGAPSRDTLQSARDWFERAIKLDPNYGRPHGWLGYVLVLDWKHGWADEGVLVKAEELARTSVVLDPSDHDTHWALASIHSNTGNFERALIEYERAIEINGNDANLHAEMAELLSATGKHREAIGQIRFAMRANPHFPEWYRWSLGCCYYFIGEYGEAVAELERIAEPSDEALLVLAASHARLSLGQAQDPHMERARYCVAALKNRRPDWSLVKQEQVTRLKRDEDMKSLIEGIRLAGLVE